MAFIRFIAHHQKNNIICYSCMVLLYVFESLCNLRLKAKIWQVRGHWIATDIQSL